MKLIWASLTFILVFVSFFSDVQASLINDKDLVRVRLLTLSKSVQISGSGLQFQNLQKAYQPVAIPPSQSKADIRVMKKDGKSLWALRTSDSRPEHLFTDKYLLVRGHGLRIGTKALPSKVLLSLNPDSQNLDVVGVLPLDEYIVGVLASEMPLSWPLETLKAQAIAARSYALAVIKERKDKSYHLESSVLDQVFRHIVKEDENDPLIQKALQAVRETKGQKLYSANSESVLKAFYHSDCGGKTTTSKTVWNSGVNTGVVTDSSCPTSPKAHWSLRLTKEELRQKLNVPALPELRFQREGISHRVATVQVAMNGSVSQVLSANEFRQKIGFQDLKSAMFEMKEEGSDLVFEGKGFGHGVGLCQWGSRALGRQGKNYKEILKHYYPLAQVR